ncbi:MAG: M48 family metallopeptidase [Proteobacteria bacterium]|nr:M48 family metallopeptidase [Pseudomonadota bacterium]
MMTFTIIFLAVLAVNLITQTWLATRHIKHVNRHRQQAPESFRDAISTDEHQKAADYTCSKTLFGIIEDHYGAFILLGWTVFGGLGFLDQSLRQFQWSSITTGTVFIMSMLVIGIALDLPSSLYKTFSIEQRFGFNKMTAKLYVVDMIKQSILMLLIGAPLVYAAIWLMEGMGKYWWFYLWLLWTGFSLLMLWLYPTVIAPLFNKFKPLEDEDVKQHIENLLQRTGFKSRGVFVMDGSKRSAHGNAYFTGFGSNKRIVFFDTLLKQLTATEIEAVLAHELGHFKRKHIVKRILLSFTISLASLALLGWLVQQSWFYQGLGVQQASHHAALALFMLAGPVFGFFLQPIFAWGSRKHEFEADDYAAEFASAPELISALVKMYKENAATLTPDPLHSLFYDSHPPAPVRIAHLQGQ